MMAISTIAVIIGGVIVIIAVYRRISAFSIIAGIVGARISIIAIFVALAPMPI
jgi:hypothetical protein